MVGTHFPNRVGDLVDISLIDTPLLRSYVRTSLFGQVPIRSAVLLSCYRSPQVIVCPLTRCGISRRPIKEALPVAIFKRATITIAGTVRNGSEHCRKAVYTPPRK